MKVLQQTENQLIAKDGNAMGIIIGFLFALFGFLGIILLLIARSILKSILFSGIFFTIGIILLLISKSTEATFDKTSNKVDFVSKGLLETKCNQID